MTDIVERVHAADIDTLWRDMIAEIDNGRDEIERLHQAWAVDHDAWENDNKRLRTDNERLREAHERIVEWSRAYPLQVFPKPDLKRVRELLKPGGMTLDAISADAMRHVIEQVAKISRAALEPKPLTPLCRGHASSAD
jgi:hypothetical protein